MVVLNKLIIDILQTYSPSSADKKFWNSKSFKDYVYPDQSKHKSGTHCGTKLRMRISMSIKVVCTFFFSSYSPPKIRLLILVPSWWLFFCGESSSSTKVDCNFQECVARQLLYRGFLLSSITNFKMRQAAFHKLCGAGTCQSPLEAPGGLNQNKGAFVLPQGLL